MTTAASRTGTQRWIAVALLVVAGLLSLPVVAAVLDGDGATEDLIVPVQLVLMAVVGAVVGYLLPGLAGPGASSTRSAAVGAVVGVVTALLGIALFSLLL